VTDRITIVYATSATLQTRLEKMRSVIMSETLANAFGTGDVAGENVMTQDINGEEARVAITRVRRG